MIGRLLGHSEVQTTERYAHLSADWVRESAVRISESIAVDILTGYPGQAGEALQEPRGGVMNEERAISVSAFPSGFRAGTSKAARRTAAAD